MSGEVKIAAFAHAHVEVRTLRDLNKLVHWATTHRVPLDSVVDWSNEVGYGRVFIELTGDRSVPAEFIECDDHIPPAVRFDILVPTHEHPEDKQPADFDWPSKDRLKEADERLRRAYAQAPDNWEEALEQRYDRYGDDRMPG